MIIARFSGEYEFLSNFYWHAMIWNCETFSTLEHAYQWSKTSDEKSKYAIRTAHSPGQAKREGRRCPMRPDWEQVKDNVMLLLLRIKFSNDFLAYRLIETGSAELIEGNTWGDAYWGVHRGQGQNKLGRLLMSVRKEILEMP